MYWSVYAKCFAFLTGLIQIMVTKPSTPQILEGTGIELKNTLQECVHDECNRRTGLKEEKNSPKKILFWTSFFGIDDYEFGLGQQPFVDGGCLVNNCLTTTNKSEVNNSAAIVFHMRNVNDKTEFPPYHSPNQHWIFFLLESPMQQWNNLQKFNGMFNLTMTYRHDSDIKLLYGKVIESDPGPHISIDRTTEGCQRKSFGEKKSVAWFVSNCQTHSKREDYVKELQKYIDVDVYGECGPLTCPEHGTHTSRRMDPRCYTMLEQEYNFYLSFENAFCLDYVTEKVFNILKLDVVPIVMGGADYNRDLPPESYINSMNFKSPKDLAAYLIELGQDEKRYKQYFKWKSKYKVLVHEARIQGFCDLCDLLNRHDHQNKVYNDIDTWWGKDIHCDNQAMQKLRPKF